MRGVLLNDINLSLMIFPQMNLHCKLVAVKYRKYEYRLFLIDNNDNYVLSKVAISPDKTPYMDDSVTSCFAARLTNTYMYM